MRLSLTPACTTGATASEIDRPCVRSASSVSQTVVPSATEPARTMAPTWARTASTREVFPDWEGPTRTTLRIPSGPDASTSCVVALRELFSAMGPTNSCARQDTRPCDGSGLGVGVDAARLRATVATGEPLGRPDRRQQLGDREGGVGDGVDGDERHQHQERLRLQGTLRDGGEPEDVRGHRVDSWGVRCSTWVQPACLLSEMSMTPLT